MQTRLHSDLGCYPHLLPAPCCNGLRRNTCRFHSRMSRCFSPFLPKQRAETQPGGSDISIQVQPLQRATTTNSLSDLGTGRKHSKTAVTNPPHPPKRTRQSSNCFPRKEKQGGQPPHRKHSMLTCLLCRRTAASAGWLNRNIWAFPRVMTAPVA